MTMLSDPSQKYRAFPPLDMPHRKWPGRTMKRAPRWLATDLRDGNQSLPDPMSVEEKKEYFHKLVDIGFKEIEVAFPSASQTDFDFTRYAVENAPADVSIQVLSPCRAELIKRTVESLRGAKRATVHIYLATSACFRNVIFNMDEELLLKLAAESAALVRSLTKDDPTQSGTHWAFEFSPEAFSDTRPDYALEVCEAVKAAWGPTADNPIIFNLPATVEMATPNIYADQIEYFLERISDREAVCISLHPHNDRGCAVAAAELGQLAGADRIEGCLFGNGERTGNVDLVTLALNLYTQGVSPQLDFSDINAVIDIVEKCNKIPVHPRAPYGGQLVVCAFSGSHQDAIKKGFTIHEEKVKAAGGDSSKVHWLIPYLPLDPQDIGRTYEAIIRVNSQSGKGGSSWVILKNLELDLPRGLQVAFLKIVQRAAETTGRELVNAELVDLFRREYFMAGADTEFFKLLDYTLVKEADGSRTILLVMEVDGITTTCTGRGNGPISAFTNAVSASFNIALEVKHYHEHSLGADSAAQAVSYIEAGFSDKAGVASTRWGVGVSEDVSQSSFLSVVSILNGLKRNGTI